MKQRLVFFITLFSFSMLLISCGKDVFQDSTNGGNKENNQSAVTVSDSKPWNKKENLNDEEKEIVTFVKGDLEAIIRQYKSGSIQTLLNRMVTSRGITISNTLYYFNDTGEFDKFVCENTDIQIVDAQAVDSDNAKALLKIKYPDLRLAVFKGIKDKTIKPSKDGISLEEVKSIFNKGNKIFKEGYYILNYTRSGEVNQGKYIALNDIKKAITGGMVDRNIPIITNNEGRYIKINDHLNTVKTLGKNENLQQYFNSIIPIIEFKDKKDFLEKRDISKMKNYFMDNIKIEVIGNSNGDEYSAIVSHPDFDKYIYQGMIDNKSVNEIITDINANIDKNMIPVKEDALYGQVLKNDKGAMSDDFAYLFLNIGIDTIDTFITDFSKRFEFNMGF